MLAVLGSGISSMSDASMPFQPAIDEPSNAWPELNLSSSKCDTGTVVCCSLPRVSVKRKSTNLTSLSFTIFITSATVLAAINLSPVGWLVERGGTGCGMQVLCQSWCMPCTAGPRDCRGGMRPFRGDSRLRADELRTLVVPAHPCTTNG